MTRILFNCDSHLNTSVSLQGEWQEVIPLSLYGINANLRLNLDEFTSKIKPLTSPIAEDFINIACYIYGGDQLVSRGTSTDVYGRKWERNLHFVIAVSDPRFWEKEEILNQLIDTLDFLTGDKFSFTFVEKTYKKEHQLSFSETESDYYQGTDCVICFSGGADSLAAAIEQVKEFNKYPLLVSHRSIPLLDSRQTNLVNHLRRKFPDWKFPHVSVWANLKNQTAKDYTQRSRSFFYATLAAVVAFHINVSEIFLSDNGIVSINLPKNGHLKGTYASRTTHPKFLWNFQRLVQLVLSPGLYIRNTLAFKTKAEVLEILKKHEGGDLLQDTVSCAKTRQPLVTPHCGVCSQCIDRRFGSVASGLEGDDLVERYGLDIFSESISEGEDRTQVEIFVGFAQQLENLSDDDIFLEYPELHDCIIADDIHAVQTAKKYIDLLRRHSVEVHNVITTKIRQFSDQLYRGDLPASSLIRLIGAGDLNRNPAELLAERIEKILSNGLPRVFQSKLPTNEHEVQDAADALINTGGEKILRELPLLPFAGISAKPDFSNLEKSIYYVEMKYLKTRSRYNSAITEITSRVQIYSKQGAFIHFVVYDPHHFILDIEIVKDSIEENGKIKLSIIH